MAESSVVAESWHVRLDKALRDKSSPFEPLLAQLEQKTGVDRTRIVLGVCAVLALYLTIGYGKDFLCNFIGFLYPAYASVKAIESAEKDDDTKWLTYWVVYSVFSVIESFTDILLSWIPLYFLFKCAFLTYCMLPVSWNGSVVIYKRFIRPFVLHHQQTIDSSIKYAADIGKEALGEVEDAAKKMVGETAVERDFFAAFKED